MNIAVSIIVPTNRLENPDLRGSLANLVESDARLEVLFVRTGESRNALADSLQNGRLRDVSEKVPGLLAGRLGGLRMSQGEVIVYLDDDVRLPLGWLGFMLDPFADETVHLVGCRYLPDYDAPPPLWIEKLWTVNQQGRFLSSLSLLDYGTEIREIDPTMIWGLCYAVRRDTLVKLGGFHPDGYPWELRRYRGDGETAPSIRARQFKLKAIYQGKTCVYHQVPKSRMTVEYFERRSYLQGISDSYTKIRAEGKVSPPKFSLGISLRRIKTLLLDFARADRTPLGRILSRITRAQQAGFNFHQSEVRRDPKLLEWVLRENYWDYSLPEGWERYL